MKLEDYIYSTEGQRTVFRNFASHTIHVNPSLGLLAFRLIQPLPVSVDVFLVATVRSTHDVLESSLNSGKRNANSSSRRIPRQRPSSWFTRAYDLFVPRIDQHDDSQYFRVVRYDCVFFADAALTSCLNDFRRDDCSATIL